MPTGLSGTFLVADDFSCSSPTMLRMDGIHFEPWIDSIPPVNTNTRCGFNHGLQCCKRSLHPSTSEKPEWPVWVSPPTPTPTPPPSPHPHVTLPGACGSLVGPTACSGDWNRWDGRASPMARRCRAEGHGFSGLWEVFVPRPRAGGWGFGGWGLGVGGSGLVEVAGGEGGRFGA